MDQCSMSSNVDIVPSHCRGEKAKPEGKSLNLPISLGPNPHLQSQTLTEKIRSWTHAAEMSFLLRLSELNLRDRVRRSDIQGELREELLLF